MAMNCPLGHVDLLGPEFAAAPYEWLAQARRESPMTWNEALGLWVVTTYDLVKSVLKDPGTYSSANAQWPVQPRFPAATEVLERGGFGAVPSLTSLDPPAHTRLRKHFGSVAAFMPNRMGQLRSFVEEQVDRLIDAFVGRGRADIVEVLTAPLPARVVYRLIGFPDADAERLQNWCVARLQLNWARTTEAEQIAIAERLVAFWKYTEAFVATRLAAPQEDYTSDLARIHLQDPQALTLPELTSFVYGMTFAGQETTVNSMGSMIKLLLSDPAQWEKVVANPALVPNAVEETLRLEPPIMSWRRVTTRDTELGGVALAKGTQLLLHLGSAGHDSARFPDGETLDVERGNASAHLSFGFGAHYCLGNGLARMESTIVLDRLVRRLPDLRLVPDQRYSYIPNLSFRGPAAVWVEWTPSAARVAG
ncbi:MAG: cytochrome P450 [Dehalococcoidia bacterium]